MYIYIYSTLFFTVKSSRSSDKLQPIGDRAETDSDDDVNSAVAIDPQLSAAIARTITDSEDESVGSHRLAGTREPSVGYNSDLDNLGMCHTSTLL